MSKLFSGFIKQNRVKIEHFDHLNVNVFCSKIFSNINQYSLSSDACASNTQSTTSDSSTHLTLVDESFRLLHIKTQTALFLVQNIFQFDIVNDATSTACTDTMQQQQEDTAPLSQATVNRGIIENLNFSSGGKKVDSSLKVFLSLIEFMQRETKRFYELIQSQAAGKGASKSLITHNCK